MFPLPVGSHYQSQNEVKSLVNAIIVWWVIADRL